MAQAKLAHQLFRHRFAGSRWDSLAARGARYRRPLWASTSTKNPQYPDTLYVDNLIGPDTVNTMPDATIYAFSGKSLAAFGTSIPRRGVSSCRTVWGTCGSRTVTVASRAATHQGWTWSSLNRSV